MKNWDLDVFICNASDILVDNMEEAKNLIDDWADIVGQFHQWTSTHSDNFSFQSYWHRTYRLKHDWSLLLWNQCTLPFSFVLYLLSGEHCWSCHYFKKLLTSSFSKSCLLLDRKKLWPSVPSEAVPCWSAWWLCVLLDSPCLSSCVFSQGIEEPALRRSNSFFYLKSYWLLR